MLTNINCETISQINDQQLRNLCVNLKELRRRSGMALEVLAEQASVPIPALFELEDGMVTDSVTIDQLARLSRFYGLHISDLFRMPPLK